MQVASIVPDDTTNQCVDTDPAELYRDELQGIRVQLAHKPGVSVPATLINGSEFRFHGKSLESVLSLELTPEMANALGVRVCRTEPQESRRHGTKEDLATAGFAALLDPDAKNTSEPIPQPTDIIRPGDVVLLDWHDGSDQVTVIRVKGNAIQIACPHERFSPNAAKGEPVWVALDGDVWLCADVVSERAATDGIDADPFYQMLVELDRWTARLTKLAGHENEDEGIAHLDHVVLNQECPKINQAIAQVRDGLFTLSRSASWLAE